MGFFTVISNGQHSKYRCFVALCHNGVFYQCTEQANYDQIDDFILKHIDHNFEVCFQIQDPIDFRSSFSSSFQAIPYQNIINLLSFVVSCDSVPLNKVKDDIFYNLLFFCNQTWPKKSKCLGKSIITTLFSGDNQVSNN